MIKISLPAVPDPTSKKYSDNTLSWQRDVMDWMNKAKGMLEVAVNANAAPAGQQIQVGTYSTTTALTGTMTGTDIANAVCTIAAALTNKGILSPTITRGQNQ